MLRKDQIVRFAGLGNIEGVKNLLMQGVSPDTRGHHGMTSLMVAVRKKHYDIVELLLKCGANPNLQADCGDTALMIAAKNIDYDMIRMLFETKSILYSLDAGIKNNYDESAISFLPEMHELDLGKTKSVREIKEYLMKIHNM